MAKNRSENSKTAINIICGVIEMAAGLLVSFFLSPYIIRTIGIEANGFVSLANNFTTYAGLVVTALNGMATRFITIAYIQKDHKKANLYYNSVFWGNLIIVAVLLFPAIFFVGNLENFVDVPVNITGDVKILFALVFLTFFVQTAAPNWDCGTGVTNRLDRTYLPNALLSLLRCVFLFAVFSLFGAKVWYVGLASLLLKLLYLAVAAHNTHVLTPELKVQLKKPICSMQAVKELVGSGIWNSISSAGNMLFSGLDLLVCNLSLGSTAMGILSLSKTLPNILLQFAETLRGAFGPELTIAYAKNDKNEIVRLLRRDIKISSVIVSLATGGIIVMCDAFYELWVPNQDAKLLQVLTALAILRYITDSGIYILANVFPTTNKVRYNSYGLIISGVASITITLALVRFTDLDLYAVAGVSSVIAIIRSMTFLIPATSHFLGLKWYTFYSQVAQSVLSCAVIIGIGCVVRAILPVNSWLMFFLACSIIAILGLCANMFIVLNREERQYLIGLLKRRILHWT